MKKKAAKIFTAFIMTAIIAQGTVMVASAAETDSTPDSVIVIETATPDSSFLESGADSTAIQPRAYSKKMASWKSRTAPVQKMESN